jgi:hypothetical protein
MREETFTARTSAVFLLGLIATSRGPGTLVAAAGGSSADAGKRKKGGGGKARRHAGKCAGADVLQLLAQVCDPDVHLALR